MQIRKDIRLSIVFHIINDKNLSIKFFDVELEFLGKKNQFR